MSLFRSADAQAAVAAAALEREPLVPRQAPRRRGDRHASAPYLEALERYAGRNPGRFHVPGHKGGAGTDRELHAALGGSALALDVPMVIHGIDVGPSPTPLEQAQELAADAWGSKRTWFLSNGATQGNQAICLALAQLGHEVIVQRNAHASTIDGLVLSGLRPIVGPELNPELGIAHCVTPESLELALADSPGAVAAIVVSPTYVGAVADVRGLAEVAHVWGVPLIVDEAWGPHFAFHDALPEDALAAGADVVLSGTHKLIGSLTQSAMLHLGHGSQDALEEAVLDRALTLVRSTSPNSLLLASLDAARRDAILAGRTALDESIRAIAETRAAVGSIPGLEVLHERLLRYPGIYDYDPLRLAIDVRGTGATGYELADRARADSDIHLELVAPNLLVALFGISEPASEQGERLVEALSRAVAEVTGERPRGRLAAPPEWGPLVITPRQAFFGPQEQVPLEAAVGRVTAESLAAYPPGIPNALPGERLTAPTLAFLTSTLEQGVVVRGLSDPSLRTVRVSVEGARAPI
jgi:arginine decarboxylase